MEEEKIRELQHDEGRDGMKQQQRREGVHGQRDGLGLEEEFGDDIDSAMMDLMDAQVES